MVKVVTINILFEMDLWERRRQLLVEGLKAVQADLIGLQEVNLQANTAAWLAEQLEMPYVYLVSYQERVAKIGVEYGIAILSRYPFIQQVQLDLQSQGRLAQYVEVKIGDRSIIFCNGHYYWQPGSTPERMKQIQLLVDWLGKLPPEIPIIAVGDFNATPDTPEIGFICEKFTSAYASYHGEEPEYTCPTPLVKPNRSLSRKVALRVLNLYVNRTWKPWRGTLDYIFISNNLTVRDCQLILTEPAPENSNIYPSDHFGIAADLG